MGTLKKCCILQFPCLQQFTKPCPHFLLYLHMPRGDMSRGFNFFEDILKGIPQDVLMHRPEVAVWSHTAHAFDLCMAFICGENDSGVQFQVISGSASLLALYCLCLSAAVFAIIKPANFDKSITCPFFLPQHLSSISASHASDSFPFSLGQHLFWPRALHPPPPKKKKHAIEWVPNSTSTRVRDI